jgi:hypothetical protein
VKKNFEKRDKLLGEMGETRENFSDKFVFENQTSQINTNLKSLRRFQNLILI